MTKFTKLRVLLVALLSFGFLISCEKYNGVDSQKPSKSIVVLSDLHFMDEHLLISKGDAFDNCVKKDRKMLFESSAILDELLAKLKEENPGLILISGDLTKDGEESSHKVLISKYLSVLKQRGAKILVVPGNHDINNPEAVSFDGATHTAVKTISKDEFATLYNDYGYGDAIARDPSSLTYVAQPYDNLRVLAIDACKCDQNSSTLSEVGGAIRPQTMEFIRTQVADS